MKADVLSEMMSKSETTTNEYSTQLKAFALMVHFKQPVAFRRLKEIFGNGWPSYDIIKVVNDSLRSYFQSFISGFDHFFNTFLTGLETWVKQSKETTCK